MEEVATVQNKLNTMGAVNKTIGLLAKPNEDVVRETLAFLVAMLFNGNETTQDQFLDFFLGTREETFFFNVKSRMNISSIATKEKLFDWSFDSAVVFRNIFWLILDRWLKNQQNWNSYGKTKQIIFDNNDH